MRCAAAIAACLLLAGCGTKPAPPVPKLGHALGTRLAARAERVAALIAANDGCRAQAAAAALQSDYVAAVNAHRVPPALAENLGAAVNALAAHAFVCVPRPGRGHDQGKHGHGKKGERD